MCPRQYSDGTVDYRVTQTIWFGVIESKLKCPKLVSSNVIIYNWFIYDFEEVIWIITRFIKYIYILLK